MTAAGRRGRALPTMRDVAAKAGVSAMTVSRVLHDDDRISPPTRQRVLDAVESLGYRRDETARNLRLGRTAGLVGLVVTNLGNPFYSQVALGAGDAADEHGMNVLLANTGEDAERERRVIDDLLSRRVDGIIVAPAGEDHEHLSPARLHGVPVVFVARPAKGIEADCVLVDDFGGTREATRLLVRHGHERIGFLGLPPSAWTGAARYRGFRAALSEAGLPVDRRHVRRHQRDIAAAESAARELLALPDPPTALFSANNRNTIGAYRAVTGTGAATELAGFDDFELADMLGLPLTVVSYDAAELGRQAAEMLLERIEGPSGVLPAARRVTVPTSVIEYGGKRR